jgi:hypothetical protein
MSKFICILDSDYPFGIFKLFCCSDKSIADLMQGLATGLLFSPGSSTNKTDCYGIAEILRESRYCFL